MKGGILSSIDFTYSLLKFEVLLLYFYSVQAKAPKSVKLTGVGII